MSEANGSSNGLTRRRFLKTTGVAAGVIGLAGAVSMTTTQEWLAPAQAYAEAEDRTVYTLHQFMCGGNCSLKCTMRDGRIAKIEPNDTVDTYYQHCCLKGMSEIQHVYSDQRLQTPLKRVGERGEGKFEVITWDEALKTIGEEIKKTWDQYGHDAVYISASNEPQFSMLAPLLGAGTGCEPGIDRGVGNGMDVAIGGNGFGAPTNETRDWVNSKTLIVDGYNYLESCMMQANSFLDAKEAGCDIIVIDPHYSTTASKASQWVPIKPGTDPALFLGMVTYILDNKFYDEDYMRKFTTFPLLVNATDGKLLRSNANDPNSFMVWDGASNQAVLHTSVGDTTALEGTFQVDGMSYTTTFELLKKTQEEFSTSWAADKTGIDASVIEDIARKYACNGPAFLAYGMGGCDKFSNPDIAGHALITLTALTGNIGKSGAGLGCPNGGGGYGGALKEWPLPENAVSPQLDARADRFPTQENGVHTIISLGNTFQQYFANFSKTREWIKSLDFILHVGMHYEDSVDYADIVLPICSKFEDVVDHGIVRSGYNHIILQGKCIDPLFESKTDFEAMKLILASVGLDQYLPKDAEELVRYKVDKSEELAAMGITFDKLVENHGSMPIKGSEEPRVGFTDQKFPTNTGKLEVYYEAQTVCNQAWPTWEENNEVYDGNPLAEKYPLQLTQTRTRFSNHSYLKAATWLHQFHESYVELNPIDMESRGLADGDVIEAFNDRGSFKCPVRPNEAVRPGSARTFEAGWSKYMVEGNTQNVTNNHVNERDSYLISGAPIPFHDTLIEIKKA